MPKISSGLILISAAVAVLLWLLATVMENTLVAPEPFVQPEPAGPRSEAGDDTVAPPGSMSCEEAESRLRIIVDESRSCATDADCTLFDYGYPIDCMTSVAKSEIPLLRQEYRQYDESCRHRVFFDCPTEPFVRLATCHNNRCEVELASSETLRDETLDYLRQRD